ncbi:membrane associated rhomboid family serine protease [Halopolyspora algeriensis]|uniref:Membrane associated rhomboid family serine protease n=1 Tax=Halopolyspora algeriensis TaxID=1500506 RepID=A0A368VSF6_9ACTN|nr:rhomboid family intramembrane serine protease [Halopolyspora algeriensis]RCW42906.1 membrane associated rhomboid family serine protease [Halopolyspora algeriensis]TQM56625.1 membrane associated rhomboid family serine protease [Halopolyspora algeriensis]
MPAKPFGAAFAVAVFVAALYALEFLDIIVPVDLEANGIYPREIHGLDGILWSPLLHAGWAHLLANTVPILVLGWLTMAGGARQFVAVTALVWILGGVGTWLVGSEGNHIGASGLAFGWLVFLLVRGFFTRSFAQIAVALVLFFYWGGMLWGVLPGRPGVSWEAHLFGALGGLLAARLVAAGDRRANTRARGSRSTGRMSA